MRRCLFAVVVAALVTCAASSEVIFRVPEVLVKHAAVPKSVGTGRADVSKTNGSDQWAGDESLVELQYEEYFVEHEIFTADAKKAAIALNLDNVPATRVGCGPCSRREMQYCESRVLADHCCCERKFLPEPFPWLPHTCYIGPNRCKPMAHDCARYARLRDCCCYRKLAERWKAILSSSSQLRVSEWIVVPLLTVLFLVHL